MTTLPNLVIELKELEGLGITWKVRDPYADKTLAYRDWTLVGDTAHHLALAADAVRKARFDALYDTERKAA